MSAPSIPAADAERLLTFEVDAAVYALPIAEVHEVAEIQRIRCVPTIPLELVGIMNWHGEALPVVSAPLLLEAAEVIAREEGAPQPERVPVSKAARASLERPQVLVVSARDDEAAQLGVPIDRVIGLVDGVRRRRGGGRLVVERRSVDGRVVSVLDPRRLVARASEVIARVV